VQRVSAHYHFTFEYLWCSISIGQLLLYDEGIFPYLALTNPFGDEESSKSGKPGATPRRSSSSGSATTSSILSRARDISHVRSGRIDELPAHIRAFVKDELSDKKP
jgi:hypothetical protein